MQAFDLETGQWFCPTGISPQSIEKLLMLLVLKLNGPLLAIAARRDAPAAL